MSQAIAVSLYDQAAQVRWILHAACAATFTLAMGLLALRLRRPVMRTIAVVWWWQLVIALNLVAYFYWREWFVDFASVRYLGTFALHLPSFAMAPLLRRLREAVDAGDDTPVPETLHLTRCVAIAVVTTVSFELARGAWPAAATTITFVVSRVVAAVPYVYALWPSSAGASAPKHQETHLIANAVRLALGLRALALVIDLGVRLVPWNEGAAGLLTVFVVTSNLVALVAFGTILLFVALENERAGTMRQTAALHAAELRDAQSERLQSLGRLASGVAHDFNNVLTVVLTSVDEARRLTPGDAPIQGELDAIHAAGRQGTALTRQLLDFSRPRPDTQRIIHPAEVLRAMVPICDRLVARSGNVIWEIHATRALSIDQSRFEQVVMNLVVNARDAFEGASGTVTVSLTDEDVESAQSGMSPGRYLRLAVSDTGCGIPANLLPSIFDPFVTTKEARGGTGLGLATVQEIARAHGGAAMVESTVGLGTTVTVRFAAE